MRRRFNLDVDGVLADFAAAACTHVHAVTGRKYDPSVITTWEVFDSLPEEVFAREEVYDRLKAEGGCAGIPLIEGAKEGVGALRELVDVYIVTSPFARAKTWMHEREMWLRQHFGINADNIIHAKRKEAIHADFFLDDKESHIQEWEAYWRALGLKPFGMLWHTGRNTLPHPATRVVLDWPSVIQHVKTFIEYNP